MLCASYRVIRGEFNHPHISVEFRVFESYEQSLLPIIKEQLEGGKMAVVFLPTKSAVMEVFCFLRRALSTFECKECKYYSRDAESTQYVL